MRTKFVVDLVCRQNGICSNSDLQLRFSLKIAVLLGVVLVLSQLAFMNDETGNTSAPIADGDKYERGRKTLEKLTGQPQSKPAKGFGDFSPTIDRFLKEHLFADIFDSDVLNHKQRELATISALAAMPGVEAQLGSHLSMGMNTGLTESQLSQVFDLIEKNISHQQAENSSGSSDQGYRFRAKKGLVLRTEKRETNSSGYQRSHDYFARRRLLPSRAARNQGSVRRKL